MERVTKKAKSVDVHWRSVKTLYSMYTCPACKEFFQGGVGTNAIRFRCKCGQELIVKGE